MERSGGSVVDFTLKLAEARRIQDVAKATEEAKKEIPIIVKAEIEALKAELGLTQRSEKTKAGQTSSEQVSGGGAPKPAEGEKTWKEMNRLFGEGEISWEEFKPYDDAHQKTRRK